MDHHQSRKGFILFFYVSVRINSVSLFIYTVCTRDMRFSKFDSQMENKLIFLLKST